MRRRELLDKLTCHAAFGAVVSVIADLFDSQSDSSASALTGSPQPTSVGTGRGVSRRRIDEGYAMTYEWADRLDNRWNSKFTLERSAYVKAANEVHGYLSGFNTAKASPHIDRFSSELAGANSLGRRVCRPLSESDRLERAIGFVRSLEYMADIQSKGVPEYIRTPEETLVDGGGDCEDLACLLAGLLSHPPFDYRTAMVILPVHMLVGVHKDDLPAAYSSEPTLPGNTYIAIEAVSSRPVGEFQDAPVLVIYRNGIEYADWSAIADTGGKLLRDPTDFQTIADITEKT